jgi:hypothetical protein
VLLSMMMMMTVSVPSRQSSAFASFHTDSTECERCPYDVEQGFNSSGGSPSSSLVTLAALTT